MTYVWYMMDLSKILNDSLLAPWFALPAIDTITQWTVTRTWLTNNDYGDMFLNFLIQRTCRKLQNTMGIHCLPTI